MDESDEWRISVTEGKLDLGARQQPIQRKGDSKSLGYARKDVMWRQRSL